MSSKKTKWTPKRSESHYEGFKVLNRLNTDGKEVEKRVCKYCAYSIKKTLEKELINSEIILNDANEKAQVMFNLRPDHGEED